MGRRKKPTEPDAAVSSPSAIFDTIFGAAPVDNSSILIFSDNNPFKRKPQDPSEAIQTPANQDSNFLQPRKTKRKKEDDKPAQYSVPSETKKSRKQKKRKRDELENDYEERMYGPLEPMGVKGENEEGKIVGEKRKKVDDPADMLVSKEGFDDEQKLLRTVFVGNLPLKVKKKALLKEFSQFGEVESVRIRSVPVFDTKVPRKGAVIKKKFNDSIDSVHAYIVFEKEQSAQASLAHNMAVVGGNHIRVDRACPPRKKLKGDTTPLYDSKRTVFVGNLPFDVKDEEIFQLLGSINLLESVEAVRVIRDPHTSVGKGIAYVLFKTMDVASLVVRKMNLKIRDRELRLSRAKSDSTPSKRKNPSSAWAVNPPPAKKLEINPRTTAVSNKNTRCNISYQGLHATKSGVQKKVSAKRFSPGQSNSNTHEGQKQKTHDIKRPSVAARKAKMLKDGTSSKQGIKKRKFESRTPESSHRKKAKKSK